MFRADHLQSRPVPTTPLELPPNVLSRVVSFASSTVRKRYINEVPSPNHSSREERRASLPQLWLPMFLQVSGLWFVDHLLQKAYDTPSRQNSSGFILLTPHGLENLPRDRLSQDTQQMDNPRSEIISI